MVYQGVSVKDYGLDTPDDDATFGVPQVIHRWPYDDKNLRPFSWVDATGASLVWDSKVGFWLRTKESGFSFGHVKRPTAGPWTRLGGGSPEVQTEEGAESVTSPVVPREITPAEVVEGMEISWVYQGVFRSCIVESFPYPQFRGQGHNDLDFYPAGMPDIMKDPDRVAPGSAIVMPSTQKVLLLSENNPVNPAKS